MTRVFSGDRADVQVNKWADADTIEPGEAVRFTLVVTNAGPLTDTLSVTLTDSVVPRRPQESCTPHAPSSVGPQAMAYQRCSFSSGRMRVKRRT